ncbi:hypothetical protein M1P56_09790 [Streptomyces sp. HU2014]|uniref:Lsr2 family DNA-binding protein n=1 Tax=Streptomyces sp. HU2014 TaxID=2939414 RepID=UPI00200C1773|nr:histone-like nucleoid-structuring protein Lsr2 [Streptomyces sp. HU2014]UQI44617.1 hypothetical protein M1P56_09790 [Streptomyces sp. HU2014]
MDTLCFGCKAKGEQQSATTVIAVGHKAWELCEEHGNRFAAYLEDLFKDEGLAPAVEQRKNVVVTGTIPGYEPDTARQAITNGGFDVSGHVDENTAFIVCGIRPAPHKVQEAAAAGTPCMDATKAGAFRTAVTSGEWVAEDPLPEVSAKKTAEDVRRETDEQRESRRKREADAMSAYVHWQKTELPQRLSESSDRWAEERKEKEDAETRRLAKAHLEPELTENQKIRAWAAANDFTLNPRGRIPAAVKSAYDHAHAGQEALPEVG